MDEREPQYQQEQIQINSNQKLINEINEILTNCSLSNLYIYDEEFSQFKILFSLFKNNIYFFIAKVANEEFDFDQQGKDLIKGNYIVKQMLIFFYSIHFNDEKKKYKKNIMFNYLRKILIKLFKNNFIDEKELYAILRFNLFLFFKYLQFIHLFDGVINTCLETEKILEKDKCDQLLKFIIDDIFIAIQSNYIIIYALQESQNLFLNLIYYETENVELKEKIENIFILIFKFSYNKIFSDFLLNQIEESLYFIKKETKDILKQKLINIYKTSNYLIKIINSELNDSIDEFCSTYNFLFNDSEKNGITYNSSKETIKKNFLLIFTFNASDNQKKDNEYTIINFKIINKNSNFLKISFINQKLKIYFGNNAFSSQNEFEYNKTYLIQLDCQKPLFGSSKLVLKINELNPENFSMDVGKNYNCDVYIGWDGIQNNFIGKIGSVIMLGKNFDDNFITNVSHLKGNYELILQFNKDYNLNDYVLYKRNNLFSILSIIQAKNFFIEKSELIRENFIFSISPQSIYNSYRKNKKWFFQNIFSINSNMTDQSKYFELKDASKISLGTPTIEIEYSCGNFLKYNGLYILTSYFEIYYNILRNEISNDIFDILVENITEHLKIFNLILRNTNIDNFIEQIETFCFSLYKVIMLINDNCLIPKTIIKELISILDFCNEEKDKNHCEEFHIFSNKIFCFLLNNNFFDFDDLILINQFFILCQNFIEKNTNLLLLSVFKNIMAFKFILVEKEIKKLTNKDFEKSNKEYKDIKHSYKAFVQKFISQCQNNSIYYNIFEEIYINEKNNYDIELRYKLLKLFYKFNLRTELNNSGSFELNNSSDSSNKGNIINKASEKLFSKNINKPITDLQLYNLFKDILIKLIENEKIEEQKIEYQNNKKYYENLKCILLLLMYTECDKNYIKKINNNSIENPYMLFISKDNFENNSILSNQKKEVSNLNDNVQELDSKKKSEKIPEIIPIEFFINQNVSFKIIKSCFACLCSDWNNQMKLSFIKTDDFENLEINFGVFNITKKMLLYQFFNIIMKFTKGKVLINGIHLIFKFLNQIISQFISDEINNKLINCLFYHIFESKFLLNNFFYFILNNEFEGDINKFINHSITYIVTNILYYHPKPFIYSFIRESFSIKNFNIINLMTIIIEYLKSTLQNEHKDVKITNKQKNNYLYYNEIKIIKELEKIIEFSEKQFIKILFYNNLQLFFLIKNYLFEISKSSMIFDPYIYIITSNFPNYKKQRIFNKQTIYQYVVKLTIYISNIILSTKLKCDGNIDDISNGISTSKNNNNNNLNINSKKESLEFIKNIIENLNINNHTVGFYLDINNQNVKYKIKPEIKNKIQIYNERKNFECKKEKRLITLLSYIDILKLKVVLDRIIEEEKKKNDELSEERIEYDIILNGKFIQQVLNDLLLLKDSINKKNLIDKQNTFIENKIDNKVYNKVLDYIFDKNNFKITTLNENIKNILKKDYKIESDQFDFSLLFSQKTEKTKNNKRTSFSLCQNNCYLNGQTIINTNINNKNKNIIQDYDLGDFSELKEPILCFKRDLLLNKLGYYFLYNFFENKKFINLKNQFFYKYDIDDPKSGFHNQARLMNIKFPSWLKNYMNCENYYPKMFLRPDTKFFNRNSFKIGHSYFKYDENLINKNEILCDNFHGLLNLDNYNLFNKKKQNNEKNYDLIYECENISNVYIFFGHLIYKNKYLLFQTDMNVNLFEKYKEKKYLFSSIVEEIEQKEKQIIIRLIDIEEIVIRRFLFMSQAAEIFLKNGKSYFFNFFDENILNEFITNISEKIDNKEINFKIISIEKNKKYMEEYKINQLQRNWINGDLSTLDYLLLINKLSGRSYNDISQYVILPWVILNIENNLIRDFNYPMGAQYEDLKKRAIENYNIKNDFQQSHFQFFYSSSSYVNLYLVRIEPYTISQIKLQNNNFENPNRQFHSFKEILRIFSLSSENRELIPEFYLMGECFLNLNYNEFGIRNNDKVLVNNIDSGSENGKNCLYFINKHKQFLNSIQVKKKINSWIDLVFGINQTKNSPELLNKFPYYCYETIKDELITLKDKINENETNKEIKINNQNNYEEITRLISAILGFGVTPFQLFKEPHIQFNEIKKKDTGESDITKVAKFYNSTESKMAQIFNEKILYMNFTTSGDNVYVLTYNQIKIVSYLLKEICNIDIGENKPPIIYNLQLIDNKNNKVNDSISIYKYLIFDVEDGNYFFIGGYYDKTIKIYSNNNKLTHVILTENYVSAIKKLDNKNIFFSGHENGKIIKWEYNIIKTKEKNMINTKKINAFSAHNDLINAIEINLKYNIILSSSYNGELILRKLYNYEILSVINNPKFIFTDIQIKNDLIYSLNYVRKSNTFILYGYTLNGLVFSSTKKDIFLSPYISENNGEIILISGVSISQYNLSLGKRISYNYNLNLTDCIIKSSKTKNNNENKNNSEKTFTNITTTDINDRILQYCYDEKWRIIFCGFKSGIIIKECMNKKEEEYKKEKKKKNEENKENE